MEILLIRHGEQLGDGDTSLTVLGQKQASKLAKKLSKLKITKVYCSDYKRAYETYLEYKKLKPSVPVVVTPKLREIYRILIGGSVKKGTPKDRAKKDKARVDSIFKQILQNDEKDVIAVFCHGNLIRYLIASPLNIPLKKMWLSVDIWFCDVIKLKVIKGKVVSVKGVKVYK